MGRVIFANDGTSPNRELTISPSISEITGVGSNLSSQLTTDDDDDDTLDGTETDDGVNEDEEEKCDSVVVVPLENDAIDWNYVHIILTEDGNDQTTANGS